MKIQGIRFENFKGRNADLVLGPVTMIAADNFRGKSAIAMAIRLGLTGSLPKPIGVAGIYKLAGNPDGEGTMAVTLNFDTGRSILWRWSKNKKGAVKTDGGLPVDIKIPELLMEPRLFWTKTGEEQIKAVFAACDLRTTDFGPKRFTERFREIDVKPLKTMDATLNSVGMWIAEFFDGSRGLQLATNQLIEKLKVEAKSAKQLEDQCTALFASYRDRMPVDRPRDVAEDLKAASEKMARLNITKVDLGPTKTQLAGVQSALEQIAKRYRNGAVDIPTTIAAAKQGWEKELAALVAPNGYDEATETGKQEAADVEIADAMKTSDQAETDANEASEWLERIKNASCCEVCRSKAKAWKTNAEKYWSTVLTDASKRAQKCVGIIKAAGEVIQGITKRRNEWLGKVSEYEGKKGQLEEFIDWAADDLESWQSFSQEKARLEQELAMAGKPDEKLVEQQKQAEYEVDRLRVADHMYRNYREGLEERNRLEEKQLSAMARHQTLKAVLEIVLDELDKVTTTAFNRVLSVAEKFTDGLLNSPLEFRNGELGRRVVEADRKAGIVAPVGAWISHETFSGTEELIAYAGFAVALAQTSPMKLVMMDELGRMTDGRKALLVGRMEKLVADGIIDQFIGIDVEVAPWSKAVTLIELE